MLELILKWVMVFLYGLFVAVLLYFPVAVLLRHFIRETHPLASLLTFPAEDSWLFLLGLALIYAVAARTRQKIE